MQSDVFALSIVKTSGVGAENNSYIAGMVNWRTNHRCRLLVLDLSKRRCVDHLEPPT